MNAAKLELSKTESETIANSEFILTKHRITEKIYSLFGSLSETYKLVLNDFAAQLPEEVFLVAPKIYKGEQYENLPYVMLDFPRLFSKENVFAIRSFFWWGNYFSITLHLSGKYVGLFADNIFANIKFLQDEKWFFGTNEDEWQHHFKQNNYMRFDALEEETIRAIKSRRFVKIAKQLSLENWQNSHLFFTENYKNLLSTICGRQLTSEAVK